MYVHCFCKYENIFLVSTVKHYAPHCPFRFVKRKNEKKKFANCKFPKKAKRLRVPREIFVKRREAEKRGSETPTVDCGGG